MVVMTLIQNHQPHNNKKQPSQRLNKNKLPMHIIDDHTSLTTDLSYQLFIIITQYDNTISSKTFYPIINSKIAIYQRLNNRFHTRINAYARLENIPTNQYEFSLSKMIYLTVITDVHNAFYFFFTEPKTKNLKV